MNKIVLPPGPEPKHLTAKSPLRSLLEHQLAFINANNKSGFLETDHLDEAQVAGIATDMLAMAKKEVVDIRDIGKLVDKSKYTVIRQNGEVVTKCAITFKTVARLLGYSSHNSLKYYANPEGMIINRRNANSVEHQIFQSGHKALLSLVKKPKRKEIQMQMKGYLGTHVFEMPKEDQMRCEMLAYSLIQLDNVRGISLFKKEGEDEKRGRITFSKECEAYQKYATAALKDLVEWLWNEINELVFIHNPTTGEPVTVNQPVITFLEESHSVHITRKANYSIRNHNVTITLRKIRFTFKPYKRNDYV